MSAQEQLWFALGYCAFILLIFLIAKAFPPKNINYLYGYRTSKAMRNQDTWDEANGYSFNISIKLCLYCFVFPPLLYFVYPENNFLMTVIANSALLLVSIWFTERHLDRTFDKDGLRK